MTSVGHTLTGLTIAVAGMPVALERRHRALLLFLCASAASAPDLPMPGWGHSAYHVSHSLFVNAALLGMLALGSRAFPESVRPFGGPRAFGLFALAWMSHLLLDSFYNHGLGVGIFWPLSDAHLALPIPWFRTLEPPWRTMRNLRVFGVELIAYGALLLAVLTARLWHARRLLACEQPAPSQPPHRGP
jgi:hypothetical protein